MNSGLARLLIVALTVLHLLLNEFRDFFFRLKSIFKTALGLKEMIVFVWSCLQNSETVISLLLAFSFKLKSQGLGALTKIRDNDFTVQYCSSHKAPMTFFNVAVIHSFIFRSF